MANFSEDEKKLLEKYVTSTEEDVYAVKGMEGMVGAAYARYSRASGGFREVLLKEFIKQGVIDPKHADELIERVLIAFGDDSVGELEGAHVSFENISMLATKEIEERRIGGSPIEQSTRYVFYDMKTSDGKWRYLTDPSLTRANFGKEYLKTMDFIFETYASLVEPMKQYYSSLKPIDTAEYDINGDGVKEKLHELNDEKSLKSFRITYNNDVRTKACDTIRSLLPLSTLTNVGMFGNGRFYQSLISHLLTCDIPEARKIGEKTFAATSQLIPQYVRRSKKSEYLAGIRDRMHALTAAQFSLPRPEKPPELPSVELLDASPDYATAVLVAILYPCSNLSYSALRDRVERLSKEKKSEIFKTYFAERKTRRDRPGRGMEAGYPLTFDLVTNWGVYKDLMRHRMNSQLRQLFTAEIGFEMPPDLEAAGFVGKALNCAEKSLELYRTIAKTDPALAQYAVLHGNYVRWSLGMNAREAFHLLELRTVPQGHWQYRKIAQQMHDSITARHPWLGEAMRFVDHNDYFWARGDSEARQRAFEKILEEKIKSGTLDKMTPIT